MQWAMVLTWLSSAAIYEALREAHYATIAEAGRRCALDWVSGRARS